MRKYIQDRIRERAVKHGILVHPKVLPSWTKLDVGERTIKMMLLRWIGEWMHIPVLSSQITASWRMCPDQTPIAERVRKSHCHVFLGGLDPGQAPLKTLLLMLRLT